MTIKPVCIEINGWRETLKIRPVSILPHQERTEKAEFSWHSLERCSVNDTLSATILFSWTSPHHESQQDLTRATAVSDEVLCHLEPWMKPICDPRQSIARLGGWSLVRSTECDSSGCLADAMCAFTKDGSTTQCSHKSLSKISGHHAVGIQMLSKMFLFPLKMWECFQSNSLHAFTTGSFAFARSSPAQVFRLQTVYGSSNKSHPTPVIVLCS